MKKLAENDLKLGSLLSSALDYGDDMYSYIDMLREAGLEVDKQFAIGNYNNLGQGYGIKAMVDIAKDQKIASLPILAGFTSVDQSYIPQKTVALAERNAAKLSDEIAPKGTAIRNKVFHQAMLAFTLAYFHLHGYHINLPMLRIFPVNSLTMMVFWGEETISKILSPSLSRKIEAQQHFDKYFCEKLSEGLEKAVEIQERLSWGLAMTRSRQIPFTDEWQQHPCYRIFLCPIIDLMNHSFNHNCYIILKEQNSLYGFSIIAKRDIKKGEQLFINYGKKSNDYLAEHYGFTIPNNPFSATTVMLSHPKYEELIFENFEKKQSLIEKQLTISGLYSLQGKIFKDKMEKSLFQKLRILTLSSKQLSQLNETELASLDFSKPMDSAHESVVLDCLRSILSDTRALLSQRDYKTEIETLDKFKNIQNYNYYNLLVLEQEEREIIDKALSFLPHS